MVVDDSAFMRLLITDLLSQDDELEVVGTAADGREAAEKAAELHPDIVLLDLNMGDFDGLFAIREIMQARPVPILILSSVGNTNLDMVFDALELGAVDYINKPKRGGSKIREINHELLAAIKRVSRASPRPTNIVRDGLSRLPHTFSSKTHYDIIVIGASTGGPTAVEKVVSSLPANLTVPVVIAQHMPHSFIHSFARRLDGLSKLRISVGTEGLLLGPGMVVVAPGDSNMILTRHQDFDKVRVGFTDETFREYNHPSINALMLSVAECYPGKALGVLLTGMGKDGVQGLGAIRKSGGKTIAQDESSSVIYGMPKMAVESGAAEVVLHIKEIGGYLVNCL